MKTKEEILIRTTSEPGAAYYDGTIYDGETDSIKEAMDLFAQQEAIEFLMFTDVISRTQAERCYGVFLIHKQSKNK